jgi:hypothetical protein
MAADPRYLYGLLTKRGYSPVAAAGILGNLKAESNLNPSIVGDKGTSFGLAQWHSGRWNALNNFARNQGLAPSSPEAQIGYLDWELRNKENRAFQGLQSAKTPQEAAAAMIHFERPAGYNANNPLGAMHADRRVANAVNMYGTLSGAPPMDTSPGAMAPPGFTPEAPQPTQTAGDPMQLPGAVPAEPVPPETLFGMNKDQYGGLQSGLGGLAKAFGGGQEQPQQQEQQIQHFGILGRPEVQLRQPQPFQYQGVQRRRGLLG